MRKVLVIKSDILPYSETFIREQVSAYTRWDAVLVGERQVPGVSLDGLKTKLIPLSPVASKIARYLGAAPWGHAAALQREQATLIHVHFGTEAVKFWPVLQRLDVPVIVTLHGSDINIHPEWWQRHGGPIARQYPRRLMNLARDARVHFIAVSEAVRQSAIGFGLSAERIRVNYIGVDTVKFAPGGTAILQKNRRILFVGRLIEKKGVHYLIEAFRQVCAEVAEPELIIVGDGPLRDALRTQAGDLPVIFAGPMSSVQVRQQLQEARVLCLPSVIAQNGDAEGLPIVLQEAQAMGVPVVTSALGGALEGVVHGKTGFAAPAKDATAIAVALIRILTDDSLAQSMAAAARAFILERFDLATCTARLEGYYDEVSAGV